MLGDYVIEDGKGIAYSYICQGDRLDARKDCWETRYEFEGTVPAIRVLKGSVSNADSVINYDKAKNISSPGDYIGSMPSAKAGGEREA